MKIKHINMKQRRIGKMVSNLMKDKDCEDMKLQDKGKELQGKEMKLKIVFVTAGGWTTAVPKDFNKEKIYFTLHLQFLSKTL